MDFDGREGGSEYDVALDGELQRKIAYGASVLPATTQRQAAQEFVKFLRSPAAAAIIKKKGMEPV